MVLIPLEVKDSDSRQPPVVTLGLVAVNVVIYSLFQRFGWNDAFTFSLVLSPSEFWSGQDVSPQTPIPLWMTMVTSMFLHGSFVHLFGNMLFLWVFGPIVESSLGHRRFVVLYIGAGVFSGLTYVMFNVFGGPPVLGASGAIAGILGALTSLHPSRKVVALLFGVLPVVVPCYVAIGTFEIINDVLPAFLGSRPGIAVSAHLGGFVFGFFTAPLLHGWKGRHRNKDLRSSIDEALLSGKTVD